MSNRSHPKPYDPSQDQAQAQAELQAQLQGQGQGQGQAQGQGSYQGQGQSQYAGQAVDTSVWNTAVNGNANGNLNGNANGNANGNLNYSENGNENANTNTNDVQNHVENTVDTAVNVCVNVDLGISADYSGVPSDNDAIDIDNISDLGQSIVMPDVVSQLTTTGSNFNLDQVSNLTDNDSLCGASVSYAAGGLDAESFGRSHDPSSVGDFSMTAKAWGGEATSNVGAITGDDGDFSGVGTASAAASITQEAFTQHIAMGANIQFNSVDLQVVGGDINDAL